MTDRISILCPTRGRPDNVHRMVASAFTTADEPDQLEVVFYRDDDDPTDHPDLPGTRTVIGPRILLSQAWNECYDHAAGDVLMHGGDDLVFRTPSWDSKVRGAFDAFPDRLVFVYGDDTNQGQQLGTHGFVHRRWVEVLGYFVPPHFSSDFNDTWLNEIAAAAGRRVYLPDVVTEHLHPAFGKGEWDRTHRERLERHRCDDVDALYRSLAVERERDTHRLLAAIGKAERCASA